MKDPFDCAADGLHRGFLPVPAVAMVTVGCVHEHVTVEVGACASCLAGLRDGSMICNRCLTHRCPLLVTVHSEHEAVLVP